MQNREILKSVECALPHKCAKKEDETKRCAYCEIGYPFVACDARILDPCGHLICFKCKEQIEGERFNCNICGCEANCTNTKAAAFETLFHLFLNDLYKELKDKYKNALYMYNGILLKLL